MQITSQERGIALTIPKETHRQLRIFAAEHDTSLAEVVRGAIQRLLDAESEQTPEKEAV